MSQSSSKEPPVVPPPSMLFGEPAEYIRSLSPAYQVPVCTAVMQAFYQMRGAHHDNGAILIALAQLELQFSQILASLMTQTQVASRFVSPPSP